MATSSILLKPCCGDTSGRTLTRFRASLAVRREALMAVIFGGMGGKFGLGQRVRRILGCKLAQCSR